MRTRRPTTCLLGLLGLLAAGAAQAEERAVSPRPPDQDLAVDFSTRPAWQERLDRVARNGLAFARLRENRETRLVVGMHPNGYVGIFLQPRTK